MRKGGEVWRLLAASSVLLAACETALAPRGVFQQAGAPVPLPPELAASQDVSAPPPAAHPAPVRPTVLASPFKPAEGPSRTGSVERRGRSAARPAPARQPAESGAAEPRRKAASEVPTAPVDRIEPVQAAPPVEPATTDAVLPDTSPPWEEGEVFGGNRATTDAVLPDTSPPSQEAMPAPPDEGLSGLDLRKSLDPEPPANQGAAGAGPSGGPSAAAPAPRNGLQPVRSPVVGDACECPYDVTRSGEACENRSAWSQPGGYDPVCYVNSWVGGVAAECPAPAGLGGEVLGFCKPPES